MLKLKPVKSDKLAYCGPACLQVVLDYFGIKTTQRDLAKSAGMTIKSGTPNPGMARVMKKYGFGVFIKENTTTFEDLYRYVVHKKIPVIVDWFSAYEHPANGHYSVVVDINKTYISLLDSTIGGIRKIPIKEFRQLWFDFNGDVALDKLPIRTYFRWMMAAEPKKRKRTTINNK
jgi:predicted double-glycine peptidase